MTDDNTLKFLSWMTRFFLVLSFVLAGFLVTRIVSVKQEARRAFSFQDARDKEAASAEELVFPEAAPFREYTGMFKSRSLFDPVGQQTPVPVVPTVPPQPAAAGNRNWGKGFKLVGILLDQNPQVIIEDLEKKETVILSRGQPLGEAVLKDIREDRAVFSYKGQVVELVP